MLHLLYRQEQTVQYIQVHFRHQRTNWVKFANTLKLRILFCITVRKIRLCSKIDELVNSGAHFHLGNE
jgi:hypothetical protein